jgi:hypothetical protein
VGRRAKARAQAEPAPKTPAPSRPPPSLAGRLSLLAIGTCVALVLCEALVRVLDLGPSTNVVFRSVFQLSDDARLQYELVPGAKDGDSAARISSAGLRDREYATPKPPGTFRVLLVGDSIAYGFGTSRTDMLSAQLASLLQSAGTGVTGAPRFEVPNLGVPGYNIEQVAENARVRGLPLQPDVIVYAYCLNDPQADSFELESLKQQLSPAGQAYRAARRNAEPSLLERSRLLLLARYALASKTRPPELPDAQWTALRSGNYPAYFEQLYRDRAAAARIQRGITALQRVAEQAHAPLVVAIFPLFTDLAAYRLGALHRDAAARFRAHGIVTHDLLPMYVAAQRALGPVFVFNALHPNAIGDRMAALYMVRALSRDGQLGQAARRFDFTAATAGSKVDQAFLRLIDSAYAGGAP